MSTDWQLNPIHSGTFLRLQRLLPKLRGFRVLFVQHNYPAYRDGIIAALGAQQSGAYRILDARKYESYPLLEQQLLAGSESEDTHIISLESLTSQEQKRTFKGLNYHREQLAERSKSTLIFWLPEPLINSLVKEAADFWAWREQVFDFLLPLESQPRWEYDHNKTTSLDNKKKRRRISELKDYFIAQEGAKQSLTTADLKHELGILYETIGEYELAGAAFAEAVVLFKALDERHASARVMMDQAVLRFKQGYPNEALQQLQERVLPVFVKIGDVEQQSEALDRIADIIQSQGGLEEALVLRRERILPLVAKTQNIRNRAVTMGKIAEILESSGLLEEALKIHEAEVLPVYEQLDDVYGKAVTMGNIADILVLRGQLDEALNIRKNDELHVYEQLGDVRSKAVTMGKIADILVFRGQLDEALKIRENDEIPVYEQLCDMRSKAVTMGKIADTLVFRGQLDEALKIRQVEQLPIFEQLGDLRSKAVTMGKIADILQSRGQLDEALKIRENDELPVYEQLGNVRSKAVTMGKIADILQARGQLDEALKIRENDELPVYEQLGDVRELLVARAKLAVLLWKVDSNKNKVRVQELLSAALIDARRLKIPEAEQIKNTLSQYGLLEA